MASVEVEEQQHQEASNGELSDPTLEQKHAAMLHRLAANEDARLQKFAARRAGSEASGNPNESTDRFLQTFSETCGKLEQTLSSIQDGKPSRVSSEGEKPSTNSVLDHLAMKLSELEQYVAEKSYFLPAYEVRASQSTIASLREKLDAANGELLPKKRFSFKSKASRERKASEEGNARVSQTAETARVAACREGMITHSIQDLQLNVIGGRDSEESKASVEEGKAKNGQVSGCLEGVTTHSPCRIQDLQHAVVVRDLKNQEDAEIMLQNLVNCRVYIRGMCRALYVHKLKGCQVYAGPVTGSALIEEVVDCVLMLASHQIRIHHTKKTDMYLRVRSRPIVEYTSEVRVAPYAFSYHGIEDDLYAASLHEETGLWEHVDDFRWLRAVPSPNWSLLPEGNRSLVVDGSSLLAGEN